MLDFAAMREKKVSLKDLCTGLTVDDLHRLTDEMVDTMLNLIASAQDADVTFQPVDPLAHDEYAATTEELSMPWTLGHVIVHTTASAEEAAARASSLARGVEVKERSRYEVPWQTVTTVEQLQHRLRESLRMRHAFLDAWPDSPNLEVNYIADHPNAKPRNAVMMFAAGLAHDDAHLGQIAEVLRQASAAREEEVIV
ncbi:MAG: DinB family protein [Anaerolineales bacterium]|nr:DinB family protein [Anaerolineales bacterium]